MRKKNNLKKRRSLTQDSITDGKGTKLGDSALVVAGGRMGAEQPRGGDEDMMIRQRHTVRSMNVARQDDLLSSAIFSPQTFLHLYLRLGSPHHVRHSPPDHPLYSLCPLLLGHRKLRPSEAIQASPFGRRS